MLLSQTLTFGARGDHIGFLDYFEQFHKEVFFPVLESRGITTIVHLGDLVDRRKFINFYTANRMRHCFLDRLMGYDCHIIAGNHDTYHKNTNEINALTELIRNYPNVHIHTKPAIHHFNKPVLFLPWINDTNREDSMELVENVSVDFCFGHLELQGFEMSVGTPSEHGLDSSLFSKFQAVFSGHFHHKSSRNNIHYLGAPYEITWADYNDERGFHILDSETGELEFIRNPYSMFHKIVYDDSRVDNLEELLKYDFSKYHKRYVKLLLMKKTNPYWYEKFIEEIEKVGPYDLQIVEDHLDLGLANDPELLEQAQDTFTILRGYVQGMTGKVDKPRLETLLKTLYDEAHLIQA